MGSGMLMKKPAFIALIVVVILSGLALFGAKQVMNLFKPTQSEDGQKNKVAEEVNVIALDQRPYAQIAPVADGHNVTLIVKTLKKAAQTVEYELEYQSGTLLQGAFGLIELGSIPAQEQVLLGSCSAGGKCSFHEDVTGGKLLLRFEGEEKYVLRTEWRYIDNKDKSNQAASKDSKFQLESDSLENQRYIVVYNTPGYPDNLEGSVASDPYALAVSSTLKGKGTLTLRAHEDLTDTARVMGYDGSAWHEFTGMIDGKAITAEVDLMELYVVVK